MSSSVSDIIVSEDINFFNEKYSNYLKDDTVRLNNEEFISYEKFKSNEKLLEMLQNSNYTAISQSKDNYFNVSSFNLNEDFEFISKSEAPDQQSEIYFISIINKFISNLFSDKEIKVDLIGQMISYINKDYSNEKKNSLLININFSKLFIDSILTYDKKIPFMLFRNFNNLKHFANILNTISINISDLTNENYDLNFAIIFIAGRTFYKHDSSNSQEKIYLCALLSLNTLYSTKRFWIDLIELKIIRRVEDSIKKYYASKKKESSISDSPSVGVFNQQTTVNAYNTNNNSFNSSYTNSNQMNQSSIIGSVGSKIKGFFKVKKSVNKQIPQNLLKEYDQTNVTREIIKEKEINMIEYLKYQEAAIVLREFIIHFANFNFDITDGMNIIVEIASNYNFPKERISLYVTLLNSYSLTIKNRLPENIRKKKLTNAFKASKVIDLKENIFSKTSLERKHEICYLVSSFFPLKSVEINNFFSLNKESSLYLRKVILGQYLLSLSPKETDKRIIIWKTLLNVKLLKQEISYVDALNELNTYPEKSDNSVNDIIHLDVARTYFDYDADNTRKSISNILKTLAMIKPNINYCQGMNYIASFIYHLIKDETETFYLMLGLFTYTEYKIMFLNDLSRLKQFFYIFDRLLTLYLPEINNYLKTNTIMCNYFCSPWFITLFTNSFHFRSSVESPIIIIKIWDDFILNGSEALLRTGLVLLKMQEDILIKMKYEELLHYLINDLMKKSFYDNEKYEYFTKTKADIMVKVGIINNIENESIQEKRLKEIDDSNYSRIQS